MRCRPPGETAFERVLAFRAGQTVTGPDLAKRNAAVRDWALARHADGTLRTASPLEDDGAVITAQGVTPFSRDHAVASVLVIAARDLDAAITLAKSHPGLAFGTTIEVRPVKPVAGPSPAR